MCKRELVILYPGERRDQTVGAIYIDLESSKSKVLRMVLCWHLLVAALPMSDFERL